MINYSSGISSKNKDSSSTNKSNSTLSKVTNVVVDTAKYTVTVFKYGDFSGFFKKDESNNSTYGTNISVSSSVGSSSSGNMNYSSGVSSGSFPSSQSQDDKMTCSDAVRIGKNCLDYTGKGLGYVVKTISGSIEYTIENERKAKEEANSLSQNINKVCDSSIVYTTGQVNSSTNSLYTGIQAGSGLQYSSGYKK